VSRVQFLEEFFRLLITPTTFCPTAPEMSNDIKWRSEAGVMAPSYRCTHPQAVSVPVAAITAPVRKMNSDALRSLLRGVRDGAELPCSASPARSRRRCSTPYIAIGCLSCWASRRYRRRSRVGRMRRRSIGMGKYEAGRSRPEQFAGGTLSGTSAHFCGGTSVRKLLI
jgi:hypothetical protein